MANRKLVIHADDLGLSSAFNYGILEAHQAGILSSTCIRTNGTAYESACKEVLPNCPDLGVGLHLNIVEGPSQRTVNFATSLLCDSHGQFNKSFGYFLSGYRDRRLIQEIKDDYRQQIEQALCNISIDHLNSHQHTHGIPYIFEITCELAKEYGIPFVRLQREPFYISFDRQDIYRLISCYSNIAKHAVLNYFSRRNQKIAARLGVSTCGNFVGVMYSEIMTLESAVKGLRASSADITEILFHPCSLHLPLRERYLPRVRDYVLNDHRHKEKELLKHPGLREAITSLGFQTSNYRCISTNETYERPRSRPAQVDRLPPKLRVYMIVDETPFYHPDYVQKLICDCDHIHVVGASVVELPAGGLLQSYLLRNWRRLGFGQLFLLAMSKYKAMVSSAIRRLFGFASASSVKGILERNNVPLRVVSQVNQEEHVRYIQDLEVDVLLSSNSLIFKENLINAPKLMTINRHSSLLPEGGGILPAFRALQHGDEFFGVSIHKVERKIDAGDILSQYSFPIEAGDSVEKLYKNAFLLSFFATDKAFERLRFKPQDPFEVSSGGAVKYFSYPEPSDWAEFKSKGGRFA